MHVSLFSKLLLDHPIEEAMRIAAEAGYEGIELSGMAPHLTADIDADRLRNIRRLASDLGLSIVSIANYVGNYERVSTDEAVVRLERFQAFVRIADMLHCGYVRHIPANIAPDCATQQDWDTEMTWLRREAKYAAGFGINLLLEMHDGSLIATADSTRRYIQEACLPNLAVTYDVGNIYLAHAPYGVDELKKVEQWVHVVHVRDHAAFAPDGHAPATFLGEGVLDWPPIVARLRSIGFQGYLSCECELFARPVAALLSYWVPTTDLSSAEIVARECRAIKALRDSTR